MEMNMKLATFQRMCSVAGIAATLALAACGVTSTTTDSITTSSTTPGSTTSSSTTSATATPATPPTSTPTATATPLPTATSVPGQCRPFNPPGDPKLLANIPLPPGTLFNGGNGATGEVVTLACTPNGTKNSITAYLNAHLPGAGWHLFDPKKDVNDGCANVTWVKDHEAFYWDFTFYKQPPDWTIFTCGRINL
jgi:hypothetical protein